LRGRRYPGWHVVWALAVTETVSYGVLYYSFAAFLLPIQQSLGYGQATLTGAFSLSVLVTGAGAVPAGAWLDRHGARGLMTAGSVLAAGCVLLWARVDSVLTLYLTFAVSGWPARDPVRAGVRDRQRLFDTQRQKALLTLTMVAWLASTIFLPGAALLISHVGWRHALLVLAAVQAATVVPHVLLLRRRPPTTAGSVTASAIFRPPVAQHRAAPSRHRQRTMRLTGSSRTLSGLGRSRSSPPVPCWAAPLSPPWPCTYWHTCVRMAMPWR